MERYDAAIVGFGKAGKTLAAKLSKSGKRVALIERDAGMYGGTCINVGCIPSKRLITDAKNAPRGDFEEKRAYYRRVIEEKRALTAALRKANYDKLIQAGVEVIDGTAAFENAHCLSVKSGERTLTVEAERIVINTGGVPVIPPVEGAEESDRVFVSETIMDSEELPGRLTIVGGGYIGLEFASMYANFGSAVTIIQDGEVFLPREDADIAGAIAAALREKGVAIITGADVRKIEGGALLYEKNGERKRLEADAILMATGRRPNTDGLNAEKAGVRLSERGAVQTDGHLRSSAKNIWAAGDVRGRLQFTYISLDDSRIILSDMEGKGERTEDGRGAFAYSVFIDPPFSRAGMSEEEAKQSGIPFRTVRLAASAVPKAKVLREETGVIKALIGENGAILGAALFCAEAHELINLVKLAMDHGLGYTVLRDFIFTHPTMSESLNDLFAL